MKDQTIELPPLPTYEEAKEKVESATDTAIDRFIYENEIAGIEPTVLLWRGSLLDVMRQAIKHDRRTIFNDGKALREYTECMEDTEEPDPIERLRFFCSFAMQGQDWLDVEPLFDDVIADRKRRGEPVAKVRDRGFEIVDGKYIPTVLVEFPVDDWESPDRFAAAVDTPQPAEPVTVPSNTDLAKLWDEAHKPFGHASFLSSHIDYSRALLARYCRPAALTEWEQRADIEAEQERLKPAASAEPSGYAYRYPDGCIRFSNGVEINGSKPTEAIPYWFSAPVAAQPSVPEGWTRQKLPEGWTRQKLMDVAFGLDGGVKYACEEAARLIRGMAAPTPPAAEQAQQDGPTPEEEEAWQRMERRS